MELVSSFEQGGSESQAVQLSHRLHQTDKFNVTLACLERKGPLLSKIDWQDAQAVPEYKLSSFYDLNFLIQVKRCATELRANNIEIVHTHDFYSNIFGMVAASVARVPVRIASKRETFSKTRRQMQVERQAYRLAHRIVVNADMVGSFLIDAGVPPQKIVTIHNGLDLERYSPVPSHRRDSVLRELGIEIGQEIKVITIVANLRSKVKGHEMFLRAAKRVKSCFESVAFVIAGEGELIDSLRLKAEELLIGEDVHFLGRCTRIPELLGVSDICVLSSVSEGFSNAILEYMAAGKPVVATRVGGAHEAVVDGETGYLVKSGDEETMSERLLQLLRNTAIAEKFGREARKVAEERFSVSFQLEKTVALYDRQIVERNKVRSYV
jgi:glycosyltransferase involved in cell wall biosynthesis